MSDIETLAPERVAPRRNPGIIEKIATRFIRSSPAMGPQPDQQASTQTGISNPDADYADQFFAFSFDVERKAIYRDADEMDSSSDEVSTALDIIADNATTSEDGQQMSFAVVAEDQKVQNVIDKAIESSRIKGKVRAMFRNLAKYGDIFVEPEFNADLDLVDVRQLPPNSMERNEDEFGNLRVGVPVMKEGRVGNMHGECAFEQIDPDTQNLIATFYPWQILHARLNDDDLRKYGRSLLRVARLTWRKLKSLEEALVIGRLTRDLMKLVFYIDTTGLSPKDKRRVLREFKDSVSTRYRADVKRENPFSVLTDFYLSDGYVRVGGQPMPMRTRVDTIDPKNSGQHNLTDIEYLQRKLIMDLRVPAEHLQLATESQPGILTQKDVQYVRWLRSLQSAIGSEILEPLFNLVLLLNGIDPSKVEFTITWPALRATDEAAAAQTYLAYAQGDQLYMQEGVLSPSYAQKHRFNMDDEEMAEVQAENQELQQQELDQAQQMADQQHQQQMELTAAKGQATGTGAGPQDRDGQRKGDEGRDRNGQRIAPTKSKRGVNNPTGTGRRRQANGPVRNEHRLGAIDPRSRLMLEFLRRSQPEVFHKVQVVTAEIVRDRLTLDSTIGDIAANTVVNGVRVGGTVKGTSTNVQKSDNSSRKKKKKKKSGDGSGSPTVVGRAGVSQERAHNPTDYTHNHEDDYIERPVLTFDLHGTLTPDLGYPLTQAPYPGVKDFLDRMVGRGACIHIATGSIDPYDPDQAEARRAQIINWATEYAIPINYIGSKIRAAVYVDDRGVEIKPNPDWVAIADEAEKRLSKFWNLEKGVYVKRTDLTPKGEEITEWPDLAKTPQRMPRGYSSPVVDIDVHRTLMPAWGSKRMSPPNPRGLEAVRKLFDAGYQIHLSCGGWDPATHSPQVAAERLAAMVEWANRYDVPYDRFVSKDDCELFFDDLALRYTNWDETLPIIEQRLSLLDEMPRPA